MLSPADPIPNLAAAVQRLHQFQVTARWGFNGLLTLMTLPLSLWDLRENILIWQQHFTWVALRYGLGYHPWATLGIILPVALVTSTLVWHTRNIIWGLPPKEQYRLQQQALKIRDQGKRSFLWQWVWQDL